jgi:predicted dehydrogenase
MVEQTSVLVVGLGQIGMEFDLQLDPATYVYSHARAFAQHPAFNLVAGVDPQAQRRATFTATYSRPAYASLGDALAQHRPSLVVLAMPTELHARMVLKALSVPEVGTILCEKPLAYDVDEARSMVEACAEREVALYVNYMRRADSGVIDVKCRLDSGAIGAPVKAVVWYSKGFLHNGSHFFSLLDYWLGPMQRWKLLSRGRSLDSGDAEPDVEVQFARGAALFLAAWEDAYSHYTVELVTPTGRLRYEQGGALIQWQGVARDPQLQRYSRLAAEPEVIQSGMARYQFNVATQLARAGAGQRAELCTGADALRTLIDMNAILNETEA